MPRRRSLLLPVLVALLTVTAVRCTSDSCMQQAARPEDAAADQLEALVQQLNHTAPNALQLWTSLAAGLLAAAGCELHVAAQHCDAQQLCEQLSQHAVGATRHRRETPEARKNFAADIAPRGTHEHPAATSDLQGRAPRQKTGAQGQSQGHTDPTTSASARKLSARDPRGRTRPRRSSMVGEVLSSPDYLYLYADDFPRDAVDQDYSDAAGLADGALHVPGRVILARGQEAYPRQPHHAAHQQVQLPPHPQTSWWLQQDMMSNWQNPVPASSGLGDRDSARQGRPFHRPRDEQSEHLEQTLPETWPQSGRDVSRRGRMQNGFRRKQQSADMENIRHGADEARAKKLGSRQHVSGNQDSQQFRRSEALDADPTSLLPGKNGTEHSRWNSSDSPKQRQHRGRPQSNDNREHQENDDDVSQLREGEREKGSGREEGEREKLILFQTTHHPQHFLSQTTRHDSYPTNSFVTETDRPDVTSPRTNAGEKSSPSQQTAKTAMGTTARLTTSKGGLLFDNFPHPGPDNHAPPPETRPVNAPASGEREGPPPFAIGHDVTSGSGQEVVAETAARLLFAVLHLDEVSCGRVGSSNADPQRWVESACRQGSRRDDRNERNGDDGRNANGNNLEESVQRAVQNLEDKMVDVLTRWNPASILGRLWTGLSDEAFLQHQQCFHIRREISAAKEAMRAVTTFVCHAEMWSFLQRLTNSVVYKLLRGQRPVMEGVPCQMDFVSDIVNKYGDSAPSCTATKHVSLPGIQNMLHDARAASCDNDTAKTQSADIDSIVSELPSLVRKNFSARELVDIVFPNHTGAFSVQQLYQLCPILLQQVIVARQPIDTAVKARDPIIDHPDLKKEPGVIEATGIQSYGLGTASVAVITLCSFVGAVLVRMCRGLGHHYAMAAMLALAVGNLCGDAVLHLLPKALEDHITSPSGSRTTYSLPGNLRVDVAVVKAFCLLLSVYAFWLLELFTSKYYRHQGRVNSENTAVKSMNQDIDPRHGIPMSDMREEMEMTMTGQMMTQQPGSYEIISARPAYQSKNSVLEKGDKVVTSMHLVWMIVVGDVVHNLADGLAIGAAFAHSLPLGLSTSLAVVCHEIPHELGDFTILLSTGMPMKRALLLNVLTGLAAFVGLYVGVALGSDRLQRQWVLMAVAGMFLYVALADLVQELVRYFRHFQNIRMFLVQNLGLLSGFAVMFGLVLVEDKMRFLPEKITAQT